MSLRLLPVVLSAAAGVAGSLVSVALGRAAAPDRVPVDELAVAAVVTTYAAVAVLVSVVRAGSLVGRLMVLGASAWGVGEGLLATGLRGLDADGAAAWLATLGTASRALGWLVLVLGVPFVFPDGRAPWPGRRAGGLVIVGAITTFVLAAFVAPVPLDRRAGGIDSPTGLPTTLQGVADALALAGLAACVVGLVVAIAGLVHRWRNGDDLQQQRLLWLALAFVPPVLFLPLVATDLAEPWAFALVTAPVPVAVAVAILQRRLYDVPLAVSRMLTYLALSAAIAILYAGTVAGVGALVDQRGAGWLPWLAAGVVAVSFAPLRNLLQQAVVRLTYGQWSRPADVLGAVARRLADATDVPALLDSLATELGHALRLPRIEVADAGGRLLAAYGAEVSHGDELDEQVLTAYGAPVGTLRWASGHHLREPERRLLEDLGGQLGGVVHAAALVDTLREAQHGLVLAREEERRRLRRDLHDGLGPALASLTLNVDELRNRWPALDDPDRELLALRSTIQGTIADLRHIVEGLRPAPLDELGLAATLEQLAVTGAPDLDVNLVVRPLPTLPAAVEVAVFRVVQEAVANVHRHAGAGQVVVVVEVVGGRLYAEVRDDGVGTVGPRPGGVGLTSMRERAEELGGRLTVCAERARGTVVRLELPLATGTTASEAAWS